MILNVRIDNLSVIRSGISEMLLHDISFTVENNSIYSIIGKNGSGKTTLAKAIGKLLDPRFYQIRGEILFEDKDIYKITETDLTALRKNKIRYVLQDSINSFDPLKKLKYYFNLTNKKNDEISQLLEFLRLPDLNVLSNLYPFQASAGMLQRVSLVLALLARPSLLILDEPTSSLDAQAIDLFLLKLKEYAAENNSAVLMITQDITLAQKISNKIGLLKNGILREETKSNLLHSSEGS